MRFLLPVHPGFGHFYPLQPLAQELKDAGHRVTIVTAAGFAQVPREAGFETMAAGLDWHESQLVETLPEIANIPLPRRGEFLMKEIFLKRSPTALYPSLLRLVADLRPDALLSGNLEFASPLVAAKTGLPIVTCSYTVRWTYWTLKRVAGGAIAALRKQFGLMPDPDLDDFAPDLEISLVPPTWSLSLALLRPELTRLVLGKVLSSGLPTSQRISGAKALVLQGMLAFNHSMTKRAGGLAREVRYVRPVSLERPAALPPWRTQLPDQPTVFASLGTVFGRDHPEVYRALATAFHGMPFNLVLTLGGGLEPGELGSQPANVHVARFLTRGELAALLPTMDLCICHAGFSSVMEAASFGMPMVLLPLTADQPIISQMCFAKGIALGLPAEALRLSARGLPIVWPERITPEAITRSVRHVLGDPRYGASARSVGEQLAVLPGPGAVVGDIVKAVERARGG